MQQLEPYEQLIVAGSPQDSSDDSGCEPDSSACDILGYCGCGKTRTGKRPSWLSLSPHWDIGEAQPTGTYACFQEAFISSGGSLYDLWRVYEDRRDSKLATARFLGQLPTPLSVLVSGLRRKSTLSGVQVQVRGSTYAVHSSLYQRGPERVATIKLDDTWEHVIGYCECVGSGAGISTVCPDCLAFGSERRLVVFQPKGRKRARSVQQRSGRGSAPKRPRVRERALTLYRAASAGGSAMPLIRDERKQAPAATARALTFKQQAFAVRAEELSGMVPTAAADFTTANNLAMNPSNNILGVGIANMASFFGRYKVKACSLEYIPSEPTSAAGNIYIAYFADPGAVLPTSPHAYARATNSYIGPIWEPARIKLDTTMAQKWLLTRTGNNTSAGPDNDFGVIYVNAQSPGTTAGLAVGLFKITYDFDLKDPLITLPPPA